jgi:hypothetical protein
VAAKMKVIVNLNDLIDIRNNVSLAYHASGGDVIAEPALSKALKKIEKVISTAEMKDGTKR